jgi:hypothetical protein
MARRDTLIVSIPRYCSVGRTSLTRAPCSPATAAPQALVVSQADSSRSLWLHAVFGQPFIDYRLDLSSQGFIGVSTPMHASFNVQGRIKRLAETVRDDHTCLTCY